MTNTKMVKTAVILLVEDNPGDADLAKEVLENSNFLNKLYTVDDGVEAISFLNKGKGYENVPRPDLIILDLNLPKKDGREVLTEIKTDANLKTIPVVILTTSAADEDIIKSYESHANCYITKPIDLNQFFKVVQSIKNFWMSIVVLPRNGE